MDKQDILDKFFGLKRHESGGSPNGDLPREVSQLLHLEIGSELEKATESERLNGTDVNATLSSGDGNLPQDKENHVDQTLDEEKDNAKDFGLRGDQQYDFGQSEETEEVYIDEYHGAVEGQEDQASHELGGTGGAGEQESQGSHTQPPLQGGPVAPQASKHVGAGNDTGSNALGTERPPEVLYFPSLTASLPTTKPAIVEDEEDVVAEDVANYEDLYDQIIDENMFSEDGDNHSSQVRQQMLVTHGVRLDI